MSICDASRRRNSLEGTCPSYSDGNPNLYVRANPVERHVDMQLGKVLSRLQ